MRISDKGIQFIVKEEGERLTAYQDSVGIWTIGVGHTGWVDNKPVTKNMTITKEQSREVLRVDLRRFEKVINESVIMPLTQHQFDALVSLAFNIGNGAFRRSTLLKLLNRSDYKGASAQFLVWKNAGGRPILLNRRKREKRLFDEGKYA
ncbi:lysozyme [Actinobacillus pleuropneumoniae]|uniref:lysozyme n=1 Tax=Actinobacillus pleuropneumoniae TaxID=715 RepID=UPI000B9A165D|nr:lysozyme [Actinobacillus pleuropneumoniae]ASU16473.1 Lysozyme RrrD [Actinobacillus pleuropneumoniae]MCI1069458.1 lysozyme [Actinobacillus pleuropneumoniae]MCL7709109.1 lysozyme [Actinobacillus pleuropneumoniae]MCL7711478.1 lysozyme [Actinobacillus pleuropneumoniae]MCL7717362.1 lysozyme [Actinobacillus pleuropneumoniae]